MRDAGVRTFIPQYHTRKHVACVAVGEAGEPYVLSLDSTERGLLERFYNKTLLD